jgi:hypothetical protein
VGAFHERGFAYITGYGVSREKTEKAFEQVNVTPYLEGLAGLQWLA